MEHKRKTKAELIQELANVRRKLARLEGLKVQYKQMKAELQEQTIEYEKLSALGRLTANVAHEIRNPITVIGGLARRINKGVLTNIKEREYLRLLILEAKRLEDILRETIIFSDKGIFNRCECDINEIVEESLKMYKNRCKNPSITFHLSLGNVPKIFIDKKQVKEAIDNLIQNAVDAMTEGGKLTVKTDRRLFSRKNYVTVHIIDTGAGIPDEKKKLIFEPFFTTKVTKKETGLGLPIARKIVEAHGGFIKLASKVGKGTTFSLYFPYRKSHKRAEAGKNR